MRLNFYSRRRRFDKSLLGSHKNAFVLLTYKKALIIFASKTAMLITKSERRQAPTGRAKPYRTRSYRTAGDLQDFQINQPNQMNQGGGYKKKTACRSKPSLRGVNTPLYYFTRAPVASQILPSRMMKILPFSMNLTAFSVASIFSKPTVDLAG